MAFKPYLISYGEDQEFIYGQTEDDALGYSNLYRQYHRDPDKIIRQEYDRPTDRQILYARKLGIEIPTRCCKEDLSTLLDGGTIGNMPDRHITEYLIEKRINFSYYATDEILIEIAYDNGDPQEKIALWIVMIDWIQTNRWDFSAMKRYRNFATTCLENDKFMNSYKRIYPDRNPLEGFEIKNFVKDHKSNNWLKILQKYLQNPTLTVRDISYLV